MFNPPPKLLETLDTHRLPILAPLLKDLIVICNQPGVAYNQLSPIIKRDAVLSAKMLIVSNFPVFAQSRKTTHLDTVLATLGIDTIKLIASTTSIRQTLSTYKAEKFLDIKRFWRKSIQAALIADALAGIIDYGRSDEAYLTGLFHNFGELVMACNFPSEYRFLGVKPEKSLYSLEKKQFGFSSCELAAWLVSDWGLRSFCADAILYQNRQPEQLETAHELVKIIYLASRLTLEENKVDRELLVLAKQYLGLSPNTIKKLVESAQSQATAIQKSLSIEFDKTKLETSTTYGSYSPNIAIYQEVMESRNELADIVQQQALIADVRALFKTSRNDFELIQNVQLGVNILFGIRKVLVFRINDSEDRMIGSVTNREDNLLNDLTVPLEDHRSVIVRTLKAFQATHSFVNASGAEVSIVDRQIINLTSSQGIFCLPLKTKENQIGVLVLCIERFRLQRCEKQANFLMAFAEAVTNAFEIAQLTVKRGNTKQPPAAKSMDSEKLRKIVHEANNPLSILQNYIRILRMKLGDQHQDELGIINKEIDRIQRIIRKISEQQLDGADELSTDVNLLTADLLSIVKGALFEPKNIQFSFAADKNLMPIPVNRDALKQILLNLIKNAVEAVPKSGTIEIWTKSEIIFQNSKYIAVTIEDNGCGISEAIQAELFKPLKSAKRYGYGIGLVIIKNLIKEMGGQIFFKTREGYGSKFQILLPHQRDSAC